MAGYQATDVPKITPASISRPKTKTTKTYQNKALDNYKKEIEYKKSLDQLSLQQEINMYQTALRKYAKITDEKRELTTKIYELQRELQEKELNDYTSFISYKKSLDKLSTQEEINMYQYAYENLAKTTKQKRELEVTLYELRKELKEKEEENEQNALNKHIEYIQYKKSLDKLSTQEEIKMYEYAYNTLAKTIEQKKELEVTLYNLRKELQQNTLDDYISNIEYRKSLDKLSLEEEIKKYEFAYKYLAKTTEQKRELEKTLYNLRKQLAEETSEKLKAEAEAERKALNKKISDYEKYIQEKKNLKGAEYDVKEQREDLDKIIKMNQDYLKQILKDERYSLEERKSIYEEEIDIIRNYEEQKRDLRVKSIDDTVTQLKSAITKQLEEMQETDKEAINKNIKLVEKWKETRINAINEEYNARIKAIEDELNALDKAEQQKSRDEEDAEYEKKKKRLEELVAFEHDTVTKANYQKELNKLIEEYQKTLDKRTLEDRKEALNAQKNLIKEEQDNKVNAIEEEAEKQTEIYNKQLEEIEEYYSKQIDMAQETAEKMLLNVQKNQDQILSLLNKYSDKWEITGQSLGEKLAQGINEGLAGKIEGFIQTIQDKIDNLIENKISKLTSASYQYTAGANKPQVSSKTVNVTQNNYIEQNPEMPSETHRKLDNTSRKLAEQLLGI